MVLDSILSEQNCPKILVVGSGVSGRACAKWLSTFDCDIDLVDSRKIELKKNLPTNVTFIPNCIFSKINLKKYQGVVVSPGLSPHEKSENNFFIINKLASAHGIPIWTEVDLFFSALEISASKTTVKSKIIAVTGTNGKTTVVSMIKDLLKNLGYDVELAGNVGTSLLEAFMERKQYGKLPAFWVLELSSFQLLLSSDFKSDVSVILNFSSDHLDWHSSEEEYLNSKLKIFGFPHLSGRPIINADDTDLSMQVEQHISSLNSEKKMLKPIYFGLTKNKKELDVLIAEHNNEEWFCAYGENSKILPIIKVSDTTCLGKQNQINLLACFSICSIIIDNILEMKGISNFFKIPGHRIEEVFFKNKLRFLNDSKATNIAATIFALQNLSDPLFLILGGDLKNQRLAPLINVLKNRNIVAYIYGKDKNLFKKCFEEYDITHFTIENVREAVILIKKHLSMKNKLAHEEINVLLSPACSSKDLYKDYAERGNEYYKAVLSCFAECGHVR
ncbi:UDP-N-acetylmuramoyl-L-alanine--D-glutamate ligase [Betaproteobacteria bacterium]|nr:UDP-N-acetylmuramoyl-L-alanine--D-glutamate ligase [Betaproteobacteria bacterium]